MVASTVTDLVLVLVAHVVDTDLPVEDPLLEAPGDSLDIRLFDAGTATVVDVLVVSPEGREEELRQETAGDLTLHADGIFHQLNCKGAGERPWPGEEEQDASVSSRTIVL